MKQRTARYVLSIHWDREWYKNFQDYRYRLVRLLDRVLQGWLDGSLAGPFQTDGQAIILEDYLDIRPDRRAEVEQRACEGKFVIGPWYVMPDEFLVSGESLVRNLQAGMAVARSLGVQPSRAGFICDIFGHNSQMPQIMAGMGLRGAFLWRGTNLPHTRLFTWRAADSNAILTYRFGRGGYCGGRFASKVRLFNPAEQPALAILRPVAWGGKPWSFAQPVSLAGEPAGESMQLLGGELYLDEPPKRIVTLQF